MREISAKPSLGFGLNLAHLRVLTAAGVLIAATILCHSHAHAQVSNWIWTSDQEQGSIPQGACYFRKKFSVPKPQQAILKISADDEYEVYINNKLIAVGKAQEPRTHNIGSAIAKGNNVVAVKITNKKGATAGFAAEIKLKEIDADHWRSVGTDETWRVSTSVLPIWKTSVLNDSKWKFAKIAKREKTRSATEKTAAPPKNVTSEKPQSETPATDSEEKPGPLQPKLKPEIATASSTTKTSKPKVTDAQPDLGFKLNKEFEVKRVLSGEHGSYIAMTFNEFGQTILSCEGKGLVMVDFTVQPDDARRFQKICDEVTNVQGILPLNGDLIVTGDGPDGLALYRLSDPDRNGYYEKAKAILKFKGKIGEHGPHGLTLGPDGRIYMVIGNASGVAGEISSNSPYRNSYEGDILERYEDPGGHALGVKAPGGTIVRVSIDGSLVETVAGGVRNAYDLTFNQHGDLFIHDSDMEADQGTPWYRPTQIFHVTPGAELGWRSGWSKWPEYFIDCIPPIAKTGHGSPTGITFYQHVMFPIRYHHNIFSCDWSNGRIYSVKLLRSGATYKTQVETFLEADGMTITDIVVGHDGSLYFCTGGRGTEGAVYRISWRGKVPDGFTRFTDDVSRIARYPQPTSPWALQQKALLKNKMGARWDETVFGILNETANKTPYRMRALEAMLFYGPRPNIEFLKQLTTDAEVSIRRAATRFLATTPKEKAEPILTRLLDDNDAIVRRVACESMLELGIQPDPEKLYALLKSEDWAESTAARRLLETIPTEKWSSSVFETDNQKLFCEMGLALATVQPSLENSYKFLARYSEVSEGFISDANFISMLRIVQISIAGSAVKPENVPAFAERVAGEFPSGNGKINRELAKILAYLKYSEFEERLIDYLKFETDAFEDRLSVALSLQAIGADLQSSDRLALIDFIESAKYKSETGSSYRYYLSQAVRDISKSLTEDEFAKVLENGHRWQNAALAVFYRLQDLSESQIQTVIDIDKKIVDRNDESSIRLKLAIIAMLGQSDDEKATDYLRRIWRRDKHRRSDAVIGLAQKPDGKNWPYLVSSISQIDDDSASEILTKLATVDRRPQEAKYYRDVLIVGYKLRNAGAFQAARLLKHWTEHEIDTDFTSWQKTMDQWRTWLETKYPELAPVEIPSQKKAGKWSVNTLQDFLEKDTNIGDAARGRMVFAKAECNKCHRYGSEGEIMGPDLTYIARRYSTREMLQSILHPSEIISDQYSAQKVVTTDGEQMVGIISRTKSGDVIVLKDDGNKIEVPQDKLDEVSEVKTSAMPGNLLDELSEQDVADLFAYLNSSKNKRTAESKDVKLK